MDEGGAGGRWSTSRAIRAFVHEYRYWLLVFTAGVTAFGVGYITDDVAVGMVVLLFAVPLALLSALYGAAYGRLMNGMGPPAPPTGPYAVLVGQEGIVVERSEAGLTVQLGGQAWPARLPPFTPPPPWGTRVRVERVSDGILVVRPEPAPPT